MGEHTESGGGVTIILKKIIIGIATTRDLANLRIPEDLRVMPIKCPETIRANRKGPHLFSLGALVLESVQMLSKLSIPLTRILHQFEYQILGELHYKRHVISLFPIQTHNTTKLKTLDNQQVKFK